MIHPARCALAWGGLAAILIATFLLICLLAVVGGIGLGAVAGLAGLGWVQRGRLR